MVFSVSTDQSSPPVAIFLSSDAVVGVEFCSVGGKRHVRALAARNIRRSARGLRRTARAACGACGVRRAACVACGVRRAACGACGVVGGIDGAPVADLVDGHILALELQLPGTVFEDGSANHLVRSLARHLVDLQGLRAKVARLMRL